MLLQDQLPAKADDFHHAYLLVGSADGLWPVLEERLGVSAAGHPDLHHYQLKVLDVDTAREIRAGQSRRPVKADRAVFVIEADDLTREAQNALLKVLEEPADRTVFFLVVSTGERLLPPLISRLYTLDAAAALVETVDPAEFLGASPAKRLELAASLADATDKHRARIFLDRLEVALAATDRAGRPLNSRTQVKAREVLAMKKLLGESGSSPKLILQYLALYL